MTTEFLVAALFGVLQVVTLGLAGWGLRTIIAVYTKVSVLQAEQALHKIVNDERHQANLLKIDNMTRENGERHQANLLKIDNLTKEMDLRADATVSRREIEDLKLTMKDYHIRLHAVEGSVAMSEHEILLREERKAALKQKI